MFTAPEFYARPTPFAKIIFTVRKDKAGPSSRYIFRNNNAKNFIIKLLSRRNRVEYGRRTCSLYRKDGWFPTAYADRVLSWSRKRLPSWIVLSQRPTSCPSGELRKTCSEGKEVPRRSFREREKVPAWIVLPCTNDRTEKMDESCECVSGNSKHIRDIKTSIYTSIDKNWWRSQPAILICLFN